MEASAPFEFQCLLGSEAMDGVQNMTMLQAALVPQPATKSERTGEQNQKASQANHAIQWPSGLSLGAGADGGGRRGGEDLNGAMPDASEKSWHAKLGPPPFPLRPPWAAANANATTPVRRRRRHFKVIKTPKKPQQSLLDQASHPLSASSLCEPGEERIFDPSQSEDHLMADIDDRRDYRRGGGGGRHAGQKRRFREDDDYDRRPQRRFDRPEYPSVRARRLVWTIADNPIRNAEEDVVAIAKLLADNAEDEIFCDRVSNDIVQIVQEQPLKIPFVAAIVLYTNQHKPDFVKLVITRTTTQIQAILDAGDWRTFKLLLRFMGCMQPLFEGEGCFALLDELFDRAADLQSASAEDTLGLELVKIIMLNLPYIIASTGTTFAQQALELLSKTDIIATAPRAVDRVVNPYVAMEGSEAVELPSVITLLQKQLQTEAENGWPLNFVPHLFKPTQAADADDTSSSQKYPFPAIVVPQTINPGKKIFLPELYFSLYADQDIETVPPTSHLASLLLRDTLVDTINYLDFNRNAAAKYLVDLDCYWAPDIFVRRATPFDKIKDIPEDKPKWKTEDLAVDAIFSQMLSLPSPEHKMVYYHAMITETCKIAPGAIAPSLGRAIRFLYTHIDTLDLELAHRFMDWFSHHLSNFDFQWKWKEWIDDVQLDPLFPRKAFILGGLDKEVRLSFAKRIRQTLPEEYQPLIPSSQDNDIPEYKYNNELTPYAQDAKQLVRMLRKKAPDSEVEGVLTHIASSSQNPDAASDPNTNPSPADENPAALLPAIDAFATTICYIGSKSLSHVLSHIERQKERLTALSVSGPDAQKQIISSVVAYWRAVQPGVAVNIVDKLLNYTILTPASVIEWALDPTRIQGGRLLASSWVYEMVEGTVRKVTGRVRQILAARARRGLPAAQVDVLDKALRDEADAMRALFATISDALSPVAEGTADAVLEGDADMEGAELGEQERALCRLWGGKWRRVFARKLGVEETVLAEMSKSFPPPAEEDPTLLADKSGGDDAAAGADVDAHTATNGEGVNGGAGGDFDVDLDVS